MSQGSKEAGQVNAPHSVPIVDSVRRTAKQIKRTLLSSLNTDLSAAIEEPGPNSQSQEFIEIVGWAYSGRRQVPLTVTAIVAPGRSGDIHAFEQASRRIPLDRQVERADVAHVLNLPKHAAKVGFQHRLPWRDLGDDVKVAQISVQIDNGIERIFYGPQTIFRTASTALAERADYKAVWEAVSDERNVAMEAVAGFHNEEQYAESGIATSREMIRRLMISKNDVVLEIGCGTARVGVDLIKHCKKWIGADVSTGMLKHAAEVLAGHDNFELMELNGYDLAGVATGSVDKVYCSAVFMHLDEWDRYRYITEALRVLRPGGRAYFDNLDITTELGWQLFVELCALDPAKRPANISKNSTAAELETYMVRAGFHAIEVENSGRFITVVGNKPE